MITPEQFGPLGPPCWSPFAIVAAISCGLILGAILAAAYALHLLRSRQLTLAMLRELLRDAPGPARRGR